MSIAIPPTVSGANRVQEPTGGGGPPPRLTRWQTARVAGIGGGLWLVGVLVVRLGAPVGAFAAPARPAPFALGALISWLTVAALRRHCEARLLTPAVVVGSGAAAACDAVALSWLPGLYGPDPAVLLPAAAWLFWVLGLTLGFALVGSGSGAAHRPGGAPPVGALRTAAGRAVPLPDPDGRLVHLQFRRWAGCPVCNVHLRRFAARAGELGAAGVREVVVFHSSAADVSELHAGLPFDVVADPTKRLYAAFGARSSPLFLAHPKAAWAWLRGVLSRRFTLKATNGPFALPADFLIDPAGRFVAVKYGRHADDGWTVDEVLALAGASSAASRRPVPPS